MRETRRKFHNKQGEVTTRINNSELMEGWRAAGRVEWNLKHKGRDKGRWVDSCWFWGGNSAVSC